MGILAMKFLFLSEAFLPYHHFQKVFLVCTKFPLVFFFFQYLNDAIPFSSALYSSVENSDVILSFVLLYICFLSRILQIVSGYLLHFHLILVFQQFYYDVPMFFPPTIPLEDFLGSLNCGLMFLLVLENFLPILKHFFLLPFCFHLLQEF